MKRLRLARATLTAGLRAELRPCIAYPSHYLVRNQRHALSFSTDERVRKVFSTPSAHTVDVTGLAQKMRASVRSYTESWGQDNRVKLLGILAHDGPYRSDAMNYSQHIALACLEDGIDYELCPVVGQTPADVEEAIRIGNERPDVHGILVYYPVFKKREERGPYKNKLSGVYYKSHDDYLRDAVCHTKDVEGLCQEYNARWLFRARGKDRMVSDDTVIYPCSALSVFKILQGLQTGTWEETVVTVVNRSEIFGRPLAAMLANIGATVYSVDLDSILLFRDGGRMRRCSAASKTLETCVRKSSMVVTGVPSPDFAIPTEWIGPFTAVVNVSEYPNVCEEALLEVPGVHYVPQVGSVTIAALEQNLVELHRLYGNSTNTK